MGIAIVAGLAVISLFFIGPSIAGMFGGVTTNSASTVNSFNTANNNQLITQDVVTGRGEVAKTGSRITVHYTGRLEDGTVFDSSVGKTPFSFTLGGGEVISGWDTGVEGMRVGGKRLLVIPPNLAYGAQDYGPIPGGSTLIFEVELISVSSN
jgi:FKBP-type peptidyl-prolyl cis-trans isomerase